jgi:membrane-associated HD superfamily phosphohydrolase
MAVQFAWDRYGRRNHATSLILYVALLVLSSICNYYFSEWINNNDFYTAAVGITLAVLVVNMYFVLTEVFQFVRNPLRYFSSSTNLLDITAHPLIAAGYVMRLLHSSETDNSAAIVSVAVILLWINFLYYLR